MVISNDYNILQYNMDGSHVNEETVTHLRQRLNVMREIVKVFHHHYIYGGDGDGDGCGWWWLLGLV